MCAAAPLRKCTTVKCLFKNSRVGSVPCAAAPVGRKKFSNTPRRPNSYCFKIKRIFINLRVASVPCAAAPFDVLAHLRCFSTDRALSSEAAFAAGYYPDASHSVTDPIYVH